METPIWTTILAIFTPILTVIMAGLSVIIGLGMKRWESRARLKVMQDNAKLAVAAVNQIYSDKTNDEKKILGLQIAQDLNAVAGITEPSTVQLPINEANVFLIKNENKVVAEEPITKPDKVI